MSLYIILGENNNRVLDLKKCYCVTLPFIPEEIEDQGKCLYLSNLHNHLVQLG